MTRGGGLHGSRRSVVLRILAVSLAMLVCASAVVVFQVTRTAEGGDRARPFVPSPRFFKDAAPGFRTVVADAYWLALVQYYGEQVESGGELEALPGYVRLVTDLSPHFERAYLFGAFALLDAGLGQDAYGLLIRGAKRNPDSWQIMTTLGMLIYTYADNPDKDRLAAEWYEKAAQVPGAPDFVPRVAAQLLKKGGEKEKARLLWAQIWATGDSYSKDKALVALDEVLPRDAHARREALEPLAAVMTPQQFLELSAILMAVVEDS